MASEFKVGDVVRLRSGGPKMTVVRGPGPGGLLCKWFPSENPGYGTVNPSESCFPWESLVLADDAPAPAAGPPIEYIVRPDGTREEVLRP